MWLTAASMGVFGVNEFAARLPALLLMLGCGALVVLLASLRAGRDAALWAVMLFATTLLVLLAAGAVMTDAGARARNHAGDGGFWLALDGPPGLRRAAGFAFFVGLAIGNAGKGPGRAGPELRPARRLDAVDEVVARRMAGLPWFAGNRAGLRARRALVLGPRSARRPGSSITS